jgi:prolyl-tRNA editing enzyme YbaK/EbsC (Cys-tRNA(Pro) deacylase)
VLRRTPRRGPPTCDRVGLGVAPRPTTRLEGKASLNDHLQRDGPTLDTSDLEEFIRSHAIRAEIVQLSVETPTVDLAAAAVGTDPERIVKSLLFLISAEPLLVIACGPENVDRRAIAGHMNAGAKRVKLARPDAVLSITGYLVGALPPFGHRESIPTIVDRRVAALPVVFAGGGSTRALMRIETPELIRACGGELVDVRDVPPRRQT